MYSYREQSEIIYESDSNLAIPLDCENMDCFDYLEKVRRNEIEDVLPEIKLAELLAHLEQLNNISKI